MKTAQQIITDLRAVGWTDQQIGEIVDRDRVTVWRIRLGQRRADESVYRGLLALLNSTPQTDTALTPPPVHTGELMDRDAPQTVESRHRTVTKTCAVCMRPLPLVATALAVGAVAGRMLRR